MSVSWGVDFFKNHSDWFSGSQVESASEGYGGSESNAPIWGSVEETPTLDVSSGSSGGGQRTSSKGGGSKGPLDRLDMAKLGGLAGDTGHQIEGSKSSLFTTALDVAGRGPIAMAGLPFADVFQTVEQVTGVNVEKTVGLALHSVPIVGNLLDLTGSIFNYSNTAVPAVVNAANIWSAINTPDGKPVGLMNTSLSGLIGTLVSGGVGSGPVSNFLDRAAEAWDKQDLSKLGEVSKNPYVGNLRYYNKQDALDELNARGITPDDIEAVKAGVKNIWDFGDRSLSTDPDAELAWRLALNPLSYVGFGGGGVASAGATVWKGSEAASTVFGMKALIAKGSSAGMRGIDILGLDAQGANLLQRGVQAYRTPGSLTTLKDASAVLHRSAKAYRNLTFGMAAAQVGTHFAGQIDPLQNSFLKPVFDWNDAALNRAGTYANNQLAGLWVAYKTPIHDYANTVLGPIRSKTASAFGGKFVEPLNGLVTSHLSKQEIIDRARKPVLDDAGNVIRKAVPDIRGFKAQRAAVALDILGGEQGMREVLAHFLGTYVIEKQHVATQSFAIGKSADEAAIGASILHNQIVDTLRGQANGQPRLFTPEDIVNFIHDTYVRNNFEQGIVDNIFNGESFAAQWRDYKPIGGEVGQVLHESLRQTFGNVKGNVHNVTLRQVLPQEYVDVLINKIRNTSKAGVVDLAMLREELAIRYPVLEKIDPDFFGKLKLPSTKAPLAAQVITRLTEIRGAMPPLSDLFKHDADVEADARAMQGPDTVDRITAPLHDPNPLPVGGIGASRYTKSLGPSRLVVDAQVMRENPIVSHSEAALGYMLDDAGFAAGRVMPVLGSWRGAVEPAVSAILHVRSVSDLRVAASLVGRTFRQQSTMIWVTGSDLGRVLGDDGKPVEANGLLVTIRVKADALLGDGAQRLVNLVSRHTDGFTLSDGEGVLTIALEGSDIRESTVELIKTLDREIKAEFGGDYGGANLQSAYVEFLSRAKGYGRTFGDVIRDAGDDPRVGAWRASSTRRLEPGLANGVAPIVRGPHGRYVYRFPNSDPRVRLDRTQSAAQSDGIGLGDPFDIIAPPPGEGTVYYHITSPQAANQIYVDGVIRAGLPTDPVPGGIPGRTRWVDTNTDGRVYLNQNPIHAAAGSSGQGAVIAIRTADMVGIEFKPEAKTGHTYTNQDIPIDKAWILGGDGQWYPYRGFFDRPATDFPPDPQIEMRMKAYQKLGVDKGIKPVQELANRYISSKPDVVPNQVAISYGIIARLTDDIRAHYARTAEAFQRMAAKPVGNGGYARATRRSYDAFGAEIADQWTYLRDAGYVLEPYTGEGQPYANSAEMIADVRDNKHLFFFTGGEPHPLLSKPFGPDPSITVNDAFRAVHDVFGHAAAGFQFGPEGELNAAMHHFRMFSEEARKALLTETHGQQAFVSASGMPHGFTGAMARVRHLEKRIARKAEIYDFVEQAFPSVGMTERRALADLANIVAERWGRMTGRDASEWLATWYAHADATIRDAGGFAQSRLVPRDAREQAAIRKILSDIDKIGEAMKDPYGSLGIADRVMPEAFDFWTSWARDRLGGDTSYFGRDSAEFHNKVVQVIREAIAAKKKPSDYFVREFLGYDGVGKVGEQQFGQNAFHAGDLGYGRDTVLGRMTAGRGTGHFGTGTYFVGDRATLRGVDGRPVQSAELDGYNLFRPTGRDHAFDLHDALRDVNDAAAGRSGATVDVGAISRLTGKSFEEVSAAVGSAVESARADLAAGAKGYVESASTRVMRDLGFEGVDVRGIEGLDNVQYGSVVYGERFSPRNPADALREQLRSYMDESGAIRPGMEAQAQATQLQLEKVLLENPELRPKVNFADMLAEHTANSQEVLDTLLSELRDKSITNPRQIFGNPPPEYLTRQGMGDWNPVEWVETPEGGIGIPGGRAFLDDPNTRFSIWDMYQLRGQGLDAGLLRRVDPILSLKLYRKVFQSMVRDLANPMETFHLMTFALTSPRTDFLSNEARTVILKARSRADIETLASFVKDLPRDKHGNIIATGPGKAEKLLAKAAGKPSRLHDLTIVGQKMMKHYGIAEGRAETNLINAGMPQAYANVALMADLFLRHEDLFRKAPDMTNEVFAERLMNVLRGAGAKVGTFGPMLADPIHGLRGTIDTHMIKYIDRFIEDNKEYLTALEISERKPAGYYTKPLKVNEKVDALPAKEVTIRSAKGERMPGYDHLQDIVDITGNRKVKTFDVGEYARANDILRINKDFIERELQAIDPNFTFDDYFELGGFQWWIWDQQRKGVLEPHVHVYPGAWSMEKSPMVSATENSIASATRALAEAGRASTSRLKTPMAKFAVDPATIIFGQNSPKGSIYGAVDDVYRGFTRWTEEGKAVPWGTAGADPTTVVHEILGHARPEMIQELLDPSDFLRLERWLEAQTGTPMARTGVWDATHTEAHARALEQYFLTGKAPTTALETIFGTIKDFFSQVYSVFKRGPHGTKLPADITAIFDKIFKEDPGTSFWQDVADLEATRQTLPGGVDIPEGITSVADFNSYVRKIGAADTHFQYAEQKAGLLPQSIIDEFASIADAPHRANYGGPDSMLATERTLADQASPHTAHDQTLALWSAERDAATHHLWPPYRTPSFRGKSDLYNAVVSDFDRKLAKEMPLYTVEKPAPDFYHLYDPKILDSLSEDQKAMAYYFGGRTRLGRILLDYGPMGAATNAIRWLTTPVQNTRLNRAAEQAFIDEMAQLGVKPSDAIKVSKALRHHAETQKMPFGTETMQKIPLYRGPENMWAGTIERVAREALGSAADTIPSGKIVRALDRAGNRFMRAEQVRAGFIERDLANENTRLSRKAVLATEKGFLEAADFAYRLFQGEKSMGKVFGAVGSSNRFVTKTFYHIFRFMADPRWWAMNALERDMLSLARNGWGSTFAKEYNIRNSMGYRYHSGTHADEALDTRLGDPGFESMRNTTAAIAKNFDIERPDLTADLVKRIIAEDPKNAGGLYSKFGEGKSIDEYVAEIDKWLYDFNAEGPELITQMAAKIASESKLIPGSTEHAAFVRFSENVYQSHKRLYEDLRNVFAGTGKRTNLERILNSYLLYWPASYMLKSGKWMIDVLSKRALGHKTNLAGAAALSYYVEAHYDLMKTDDSYRKMFVEHPALFGILEMMLPNSPWGIGVSLSKPVRYLYTNIGAELGLLPKDATYKAASNPITFIGSMAKLGPLYTFGVPLDGFWSGPVPDLAKELGVEGPWTR